MRFDDKIKLAELLKNCTREKLTRVVQLVRGESGHDQTVVDEMGQGRFQLKIDQIQKPLFEKCMAILSADDWLL